VAGFLNLHADTPPLSLVDAGRIPQGHRFGNISLGVRPEDVDVSREAREGGVRGTIAHALALPMKNVTILRIELGEEDVHARISGNERYARGDQVWLTFKRHHVFDQESGLRLRTYPEDG